MRTSRTETRGEIKHQRIWYGLTATVVIGPGFRHDAGFGWFLIPHPPLANWLLRRGTGHAEGQTLSFMHEVGHFQTAPLALLLLGANMAAAGTAGRLTWAVGPLLLVSNHAAWEILAEMAAIVGNRPSYRRCYQGTSKLPRVVFWITAAALSLAGWSLAI